MSKLSLSVLRNKNLRLLMLMRVCATTAVQAQAVIVGWQVYSLTHNVFLLGLIGLAEAVPAITGALVSGYIVDRVGRPGFVLNCAVALFTVNMAVFLAFGGGLVAPPGGSLLPWLFSGVFASGLIRSFYSPSLFSIVPRLVTRSELGAAQAWMTSVWQIAAISGPAIAGLIYGGYGARGAWLYPALLSAMSLATALSIKVPDAPRAGEKKESAVHAIRAGWHFIFTHPVLLATMALDMFAVLFGGAVAMLPAYADKVLHVGAEGLGALRAAPMFGAVVVTLYLAVNPLKQLSAVRLLAAVAGFGLSIIAFGLSTSFALSMLCLALSGAFDAVSVVIRNTLLQLLTPDHMKGRVSSISNMFVTSSNEIGAFESGTAARLLGLVPSVVAGGIGTLLVVAIVALASPKFRKTVVEA
jgi:MFS family permease